MKEKCKSIEKKRKNKMFWNKTKNIFLHLAGKTKNVKKFQINIRKIKKKSRKEKKNF